MTTPRDEGAADSDPQQTEHMQPASQPAAHQPPTFPSVGGQPDSPTRVDNLPAFSRVGAYGDTSQPPIPVAATGPAFSATNNARWRWIAAGLATLLVLAVVLGAFLFLSVRRPGAPSVVAQYVPANPAAYVEMRLDFPGDQRDRMASFMSNFPGFADPASFQRKVDETLANVVKSAGAQLQLDWQTDVKPWFGGMIGMAVTSLDRLSDAGPSGVVVLSVSDPAKLNELIAARGGATMQTEDYKGDTIYSGAAGPDGQPFSFVATDDALLASPQVDDLKAALDAHAGSTQGFADDAFFTGQLAELSSDHLGLFYYDYGKMLDAMPLPTRMPVPSGMPGVLPDECMSGLASVADLKVLGEVRAESDHLQVEVRAEAPHVEGLPQFPNRNSGLAASMPSDTVAYLEYRAIGQSIKYYVGKLLQCLPSDGTSFSPDQLRQMLGTAPEDYFDFLEDVAIGVTVRDDKFGGGLIATVNDETVARVRMERILSALRLAAGARGGITIEEQQHGDATITVVNLGDQLVPGTDIPSLAVSVAGGRVYLGLDEFVVRALDQAEADSLASAPRLVAALDAAGHENAGLIYVDLTALRGFVERMIPATERTRYESEVKPFVEPISKLVMVSRNEQGIYSSNVFLYVE